MKDLLMALIFCGLWLLASSEYYIHQNRFLDRTEVRDESGRAEIRTTDGRKTGEIHRNRFLDRVEIMDKSGQNRFYIKKNPLLDRMDIFKDDGQRTGKVRYNRLLDRMEVTVEEVK